MQKMQNKILMKLTQSIVGCFVRAIQISGRDNFENEHQDSKLSQMFLNSISFIM